MRVERLGGHRSGQAADVLAPQVRDRVGLDGEREQVGGLDERVQARGRSLDVGRSGAPGPRGVTVVTPMRTSGCSLLVNIRIAFAEYEGGVRSVSFGDAVGSMW